MSGKKRGNDASNNDSSTDPNYYNASYLPLNLLAPGEIVDEQGLSPGKRAKTDDAGDAPGTAGNPGIGQSPSPTIAGSEGPTAYCPWRNVQHQGSRSDAHSTIGYQNTGNEEWPPLSASSHYNPQTVQRSQPSEEHWSAPTQRFFQSYQGNPSVPNEHYDLHSLFEYNYPYTSDAYSVGGSGRNALYGSAYNQPSTSGGYPLGYPPEPAQGSMSAPRNDQLHPGRNDQQGSAHIQPSTSGGYLSGYSPGLAQGSMSARRKYMEAVLFDAPEEPEDLRRHSVRPASVENPNNQFVTNPAHSTGYPYTPGNSYPHRSGLNQPSSSSDPRFAERFGNSGSAISARSQPIIRLEDLQKHVPARVDLQTPVDIFVDSMDYMVFLYTFSHEVVNGLQTSNARRWDLAILAALSFIFTGEVFQEQLCSIDQRTELVREYLKQSPLPRRAAPIVSQLSVIVDRAKSKWERRYLCRFFFIVHSLIILIGSLRNELRTRFFSENINDETLVKKIVQEIIFSFEEKCLDDMQHDANERAESKERKQAFIYLLQQKPKRCYSKYAKFLKPFREALANGFEEFVHFWQDFPTPDDVEQLIGKIVGEENEDVNTNEPLEKQDDDNNKRLRVLKRGDDPIVQDESPNNNHWLSEVFSDIAPYLNKMTNGEEQDQLDVPRTTDQRILSSIDNMLSNLNNRWSVAKEKELDVQEQQAMSAIAKSVCQLIITERSIQKRIFSTWKEDSKTFINGLSRRLENFVNPEHKSFRKLVDFFGILRLHDRYRIDAAIEAKKNYDSLRTETNPDRAIHLIIGILRSKRIDLVFGYPIPRRVINKTLKIDYKCDEQIGGRPFKVSVSLQKLEDNIPSIAVLTINYNYRKQKSFIYIRIDSGLIDGRQSKLPDFSKMALAVLCKRHPSAKIMENS